MVGGLFRLCIGDALGLPVEGVRRAVLRDKPVEGLGYDEAVRDTPRGWWSDDSSLSFCLAESLCSGFDLQKIAEKYLRSSMRVIGLRREGPSVSGARRFMR